MARLPSLAWGKRAGASPAHFRLRPLGRPTRKYLKPTCPLPAGNRASHLRQLTLPCCRSQTLIETTLYSASQDGQVKRIGSDLLIVQKKRNCENESGAYVVCHVAPS